MLSTNPQSGSGPEWGKPKSQSSKRRMSTLSAQVRSTIVKNQLSTVPFFPMNIFFLLIFRTNWSSLTSKIGPLKWPSRAKIISSKPSWPKTQKIIWVFSWLPKTVFSHTTSTDPPNHWLTVKKYTPSNTPNTQQSQFTPPWPAMSRFWSHTQKNKSSSLMTQTRRS